MTSVSSRLAGLVAAALAAAAGLVGVTAGSAAAAQCSGSGVSVVVDFGSLGAGVQKGCDPRGANRSASKVFPAAGFPLTYAAREPGFVCRVKNTPTSDPCGNASPTNAYWGLFWSNGKSGKWAYASSGAGGTSVPNGGFLAFAWQDGGDRDWPRASPVNSKPAPKPQPTKAATKAPTKKKATQQSDSGSGSTKAKAPEQATPGQPDKTQAASGASQQKKKAAKAKRTQASKQSKAKAKAKAKAKTSASASSSASAATDPSDDASPDANTAEKVNSTFAPEEDQGGLPVWVPIVVIGALAGAAGGTAWWRRRTGAP